jgi:histidyl-tRNA synthetase
VKFQAIKGVRDILPPDSALWNRVERTARDVFETYGYGEIRLPIFEPTELFARSIGEETDVVSKEMYSFEDYEHKDLAALRTLLVSKQPLISDPNLFWAYELRATEFRERLRLGIEKGEIAKTPENNKVLDDLGPVLDSLAADREEYKKTEDAALFERFNLYVSLVRNYLLATKLGDDLTLRPEATASVVRAYIEHGMQTLPSPVKLYYTGPMFRRERPQKGRYRQFYQIGAEVLGPNIAHFAIDAEVISMLMTLFDRCGLTGQILYVNSVGDKNCRPAYVEKLREELRKVKDRLGPDSQRRIETNPLRVFDSKSPEEQEIIEALPKITGHLCAECESHFEGLKVALRKRDIKFQVNPRLVRGLDYYVRTTFEVTAPGQGSQNAICGGGRYDGLVELIGGAKFRDIKGVGFAIGEDRLIEALRHEGIAAPSHVDVLVAWKDHDSREHAEKIAHTLRLLGLVVEVPVKPMPPGEGLGLAKKRDIPIGVVIGPGEVSAAAFSVRLLSEGDQVSLTQSQVDQFHLQRLLKFRVLLERELQETAIINGVEHKGLPLPEVAAKLVDIGALPGHLKILISMALDTFNKLMHGQKVPADHRSEAVAASVQVLDELSAQGPRPRFRIG